MNWNRYLTVNPLNLLRFACCTLLLAACDVLENDVTPEGPGVEIGDTQVYTLSNSTAYIDLYSLVKTQGTVRLDIASQPTKGSLTELSRGFLLYSPGEGFTKGRDAFRFSIYSEDDQLLKTDSIIIIVEDDTTNLPCGIYAVNDSVIGTGTEPVTIDVLRNDILCSDSTNLKVEVYRPNETFPPYNGSAEVLSDNRIRYTPGSTSTGWDKIVYKVYSVNDSSIVSFGMVYIIPEPSCVPFLADDDYTAVLDTLQQDTLWIPVFANDVRCANDSVRIVNAPHHGTAYVEQDNIKYVLSDSVITEVKDSLTYKVCAGQHCDVAKVRITVKLQ
jgi:hypothetical protein